MLREKGYEVKAFIEDVAEPDWKFIESSDLVCISTITSTAIRAYDIGERLQALHIPVVMGGAHPTFMADECLEHADFVIRGEGENSLGELLEHLETGTPARENIKGLSYKAGGNGKVHNSPREFIDELDSLPTPDFSLVHKWNPSNPYPISTSRGCPHACKFCSVITMFGRKYRFQSVEATLRAIRYATSVSKATKFIVDDNFAANTTRSKEILRGMIAEGIKTPWSAQVRTDIARDPKLLRLMADTGCRMLFIGFESINPKTLAAYNKKQNMKDIVNCIRAVKDYGIRIHGMFAVGADTDDVQTIRETARFATALGIDTVQFLILTPLPGTPLFDDMVKSERLLHRLWNKYDVHHVVFKSQLVSPATLQIETFKAMGRFYSWKYIAQHLGRLDFQYAAIGLFGKVAVHHFLQTSARYVDDLMELESKTSVSVETVNLIEST
jgi:radical SAM superfamily enzyme YgiQ (UPF0313 family)